MSDSEHSFNRKLWSCRPDANKLTFLSYIFWTLVHRMWPMAGFQLFVQVLTGAVCGSGMFTLSGAPFGEELMISHARTHARTHACTVAHTRTYPRTHARARTHACTHTYTYIHTHIHIRTHRQTHTHARTHTHFVCLKWVWLFCLGLVSDSTNSKTDLLLTLYC